MNTVLLAVILIPIVEIYLFIKIGSQIGAFSTIFLILFTAVVGVYYAKYEGINTLRSGMTQIIKNQIQNSGLNIECIEGNKFIELSSSEKKFDVIYPCVGENMFFLKRIIKKNNLMINYLVRNEDKYCWQFSNKGYFNFKSNIPKILSQFKLN